MANILIVVRSVRVLAPPLPEVVLNVNDQVLPSSPYYRQLLGTANVSDSGIPAPSDPVLVDPPAPVVTVGTKNVGDYPRWNGTAWVSTPMPALPSYPTLPDLMRRMTTL